MGKYRAFVPPAAVLLAGASAWAFVSANVPPLPPIKLPIERDGILVSEVAPDFRPAAKSVGALAGDWLVQTERLSLVFAADTSALNRRARLGSLLDVGAKGLEDDNLQELRTVLQVEGRAVSLEAKTVTIADDQSPGRPSSGTPSVIIRVEQSSRDGRLKLATDYEVRRSESIVRIVTLVQNQTASLIRSVQVGDRAIWPGASSFAPRTGFVKTAMHAEVPWVAREGKRTTYVLGFGGQSFEAEFAFDIIGPMGQVTLAPSHDLLPFGSFEIARELIAVPGGLDAAAELAFRNAGKDVGFVHGMLSPAPSWATIEARYPDNKTALVVHADPQGQYTLPLPAGEYHLLLRSPGGEDQDQISVEPGPPAVEANLMPPRAGMLRYSITDSGGNLLPARLVVHGIAPTKDPEFGPVQSAASSGNTVYVSRADGFVELPPGRYRVVVTRGPEYELAEREVEVGEEEGAALHVALDRVVDTHGWIACDFHVHAAPSPDSEVTLDDRLLSLAGEGIEFMAATDHDHVTDYSPIAERLELHDTVGTIPGVEITTNAWGHFNAFPYPLLVPPPPHVGLEPAEIFATARARAPGAVIQVNHPRMPGVGYFIRGELDPVTGVPASEAFSFDFDAIELANGYDLENPRMLEDNLREYFAILNSGHRFAATGNSDSHHLSIQWAGNPRTYVRVADDRTEVVTPAELAKQLAQGHASVSNGIFLLALANGVAEPGDTLAEERVSLQVSARAPEWVSLDRLEVYANGEKVAERPAHTHRAGPQRIDWQVDLDLKVDTWLMVVAHGDEPMDLAFPNRRVLPFAFTDPIFIDADQDGVFKAVAEGVKAAEPATGSAAPPRAP